MDDDRTLPNDEPRDEPVDLTPDLTPQTPDDDEAFDFLTASFESPDEAEEAEVADEPEPTAPARPFAVLPDELLQPEEVVEPELAAEPEPEADSWPAPALASAPELEPEPEVELPAPVPDPEPTKIPWYKREISLGGGAKPAGEQPAREERRPQRRLRPEPEVPVEEPSLLKREVSLKPKRKRDETDGAEHVPFYKRELSLKRKPRDEVEPEPVETVAPEPAAEATPERVPFYKREISLGRKAKAADVEAPAPLAPSVASKPAEERVPLHRREVKLRRRERAVPAAPVASVAADEPTEERKPLHKREISFKRRTRRVVAEAAPVEPDETKESKAPKVKRERRKLSMPTVERRARSKHKAGTDGKRHKKLVGLKIGASQLAAAQVVNNGHAELVKVARDELLEGIVAGGELRDPEALTAALRAFFKKHNLPRRNVRLGIANNRIGVRTFDITGISDTKQLANAVRFRAQEALPIPIEEAVIDWRILSEHTDDEGQLTRRILLVVAHRELVDRYVSACRKAGVQLIGIDLEAFALLRALGDGEKRASDDGALVAVSVGHERSTFAVSNGEVCEFTRVLEWGGNSLNVAIARALDKAPSEVEALKRALSLDHDDLPEGVDEEAAVQARDAVRRQLQTFARELVSSLQFYQNQPGSLGIGEIMLTGGTTQMPGLAHELERLIGVRVRVGDPLRRVRASKRVAGDDLGSLSVAIGLGIED